MLSVDSLATGCCLELSFSQEPSQRRMDTPYVIWIRVHLVFLLCLVSSTVNLVWTEDWRSIIRFFVSSSSGTRIFLVRQTLSASQMVEAHSLNSLGHARGTSVPPNLSCGESILPLLTPDDYPGFVHLMVDVPGCSDRDDYTNRTSASSCYVCH